MFLGLGAQCSLLIDSCAAESAAIDGKIPDGSTSPPEIHSVVKNVHGRMYDLDLESSLHHEQDLLGAIFRQHDPAGALSERGSSGSPPPARHHESVVEENSEMPQGTRNVEATAEAIKSSDVTALLVKGSKKSKKSHARKQPKGHIPRPRNA